MAGYYRELILETSRAFPDDEEEDEDGIPLENSIEFEATSDGEVFLREFFANSHPNNTLYIFYGKVGLGFGQGFLDASSFQSLGCVYYNGLFGTVDSLLSRPGRRPVVRIYRRVGGVIFAFVDAYGLPRCLSNDVVQAINPFIVSSKHVVVFHSEPIVSYLGEEDVQGSLFYLKTSTVESEASSIFRTSRILPRPNIIFGVSAAGKNNNSVKGLRDLLNSVRILVLTNCEENGIAGVILISYCETPFVDSISIKPFFGALVKGNTGVVNIRKDFGSMEYNSSRAFKLNLNPVADSNLYT